MNNLTWIRTGDNIACIHVLGGGGGGGDSWVWCRWGWGYLLKGQYVRDQGLSIIRISSITIYSPN